MIRFADIFGQDSALAWLGQAYQADRLPHALLFAGPVGVGKATAAEALAGLFLCQKPRGLEPCGKCDSCRALATGAHPDYHRVYKELVRFHDKTGESKATQLSIGVIRPELIEPASRKAAMGRGKVFVIEQAELMNTDAQNCMLKTLEEPAGRTLIVLLTDQPEGLLATVRSRCQIVRFAALDADRVRSELVRRGIEPAVAADAADLAEGSLGLALRWIEDGVVAAAGQLRDRLRSLLAGETTDDLRQWFKKASEDYAEKQLERDELSSKSQATRDGLVLYLRVAAQFFRRRLVDRADDPRVLRRLCDAIDAVAEAETYVDANVNVPLIFAQLEGSLSGS